MKDWAVRALKTFGAPVEVTCSSHDKGPAAKKVCQNACIGCGLCMRNCSRGAIKVENFLAVVEEQIKVLNHRVGDLEAEKGAPNGR